MTQHKYSSFTISSESFLARYQMNTIAAKREFSIRIMMMNWPVEQILSF